MQSSQCHPIELTRILNEHPHLNTDLTLLLGVCADGITFVKSPSGGKKKNREIWPFMGKWICDSKSQNLIQWPVLAIWPFGKPHDPSLLLDCEKNPYWNIITSWGLETFHMFLNFSLPCGICGPVRFL